MAVMTSETSEGVAFEQKTQPVPSSDKMALDLDINGTSNRHETNIDLSPTDPSYSLNQNLATPSSLSPSDELVPRDAEIKATSLNAEAFSSNNMPAKSALDPVAAHHNNIAAEAQITQESSGLTAEGESSFLDSQDTSAPTAQTPLSASPSAQPLQTSSDLLASAESAVEAAVEDHTGTSTIPPVIDAPESDLRDTSIAPDALHTEEPILDTDLPLRPVDELLDAQDNSAPLETNATAEKTNHTHNMSSPAADNAHPFPDESFEMANSTPTQGNNTEGLNDTEMTDAPPSSTDRKISRGREDDEEEERSAKRTKTEDIEMEGMDGTPRPEAALQNGDAPSSKTEDIPMTQHQIREISKVLKSAVRTQAGKNFRAPAVELWPSFAEPYLAKVPHPIDLGTIDKKIKENAYLTYGNFTADVNLLADNAVLFNGPDHVITKAAQSVRDSILDKTRSIPREVAQPPKPQKKGVAKRSTPSAESASKSSSTARRGSTTRPTGATVKNETFALNPATGLPPPRRNSNMADDGGRPKREIHPPKNKDLPYSVGRPKGRKNATELKFCDLVLTELKKNKYAQFNFAFLEPVDPVAMNIPDYFKLIKHPMDLQTITNKLADGHYIKARDFEADVRLMLSNCFKFNPSPHPVHQMGKDMENLFNQQWQRKSQYISDHTPAALSPSSTVDSEDESDEEVAPEPAAARGPSAFAQRLIVEQSKLIELMSSQASGDEISMQQDIVAMVQSKVDTENQQAAAPKKPNKKAKSATSSKPAKKNSALAKKSSTSTGNKKSGGRPRYIGATEREVVSAGVGLLPDETSGRVMDLIKGDIPDVKTDGDGSLELEIDALSDATLWELYDMVVKHLPEVANTIRKQKDEQRVKSRTSSQPKPKKKNKPMSKGEQERKIQHLKNSIETFERHGSGSQEPVMPTVEQQDESSGDESSDSEEE